MTVRAPCRWGASPSRSWRRNPLLLGDLRDLHQRLSKPSTWKLISPLRMTFRPSAAGVCCARLRPRVATRAARGARACRSSCPTRPATRPVRPPSGPTDPRSSACSTRVARPASPRPPARSPAAIPRPVASRRTRGSTPRRSSSLRRAGRRPSVSGRRPCPWRRRRRPSSVVEYLPTPGSSLKYRPSVAAVLTSVPRRTRPRPPRSSSLPAAPGFACASNRSVSTFNVTSPASSLIAFPSRALFLGGRRRRAMLSR